MGNIYLEYFLEESDNYVLEMEGEYKVINNSELKELVNNSNFEVEYIDIDTYEYIKGKINRKIVTISVL